ncbi:hypothetical protein FCM35_KLT22334 [Carex littledalei]|uniref:KIB1-4 beta-propeller domain-containing protein n=1 Tax=Carex littledalei TaxID=544730 RepID=A0A833V1S8_9POAL|nr:hypothetical protein FCM35_KLT22334 [Carex littledalei]
MILVGCKAVPAFWKPGDSSWTVISVITPTIDDVIYFNGHFYFVTCQNQLLFLDFQPDPKMYDIRSPRIVLRRPIAQSYLVDYFGHLLLVERWDRDCIEKRHYKTRYFKVLRPDFEKKKVYKWKTIGEVALFLGTNDSIVIYPSELVPGCKCKTNSIYFTDVTRTLSDEIFGCDDMGIFNTRDKTFGTFYPPEIRHTRVGTPIWFTPNPW